MAAVEPVSRHTLSAGQKENREVKNERTIMLCTVKTLTGYKLDGIDGEIGRVKEFYFDDRHWTIRYLVAETGTWLAQRQVLISPYVLLSIVKEERHVDVGLTKRQIENSPSLESDKPVSLQFEQDYFGYYDFPTYWSGLHQWGSSHYIERDREKWKQSQPPGKPWDHHLRSTHAVSGYHVQAKDGEIGHVEDFIIDDETWAIRYLMINTHNLWPGRKVLISPQWIESVSWGQSKVFINLSRESVKHSPEYTEEFLLTRDYETELHKHYHRQAYWLDELVAI
jgi:uncharacterized protein YrrD